jgi:hypothetical protein
VPTGTAPVAETAIQPVQPGGRMSGAGVTRSSL